MNDPQTSADVATVREFIRDQAATGLDLSPPAPGAREALSAFARLVPAITDGRNRALSEVIAALLDELERADAEPSERLLRHGLVHATRTVERLR